MLHGIIGAEVGTNLIDGHVLLLFLLRLLL